MSDVLIRHTLVPIVLVLLVASRANARSASTVFARTATDGWGMQYGAVLACVIK